MIMNGSYAKGVSRGAIYTKKYEGVDPETGWGRWAAYKNENGTSTDTSYIPEPYKYLRQRTVDNNGKVVDLHKNATLTPFMTNDYRKAAYEYVEGKSRYPDNR